MNKNSNRSENKKGRKGLIASGTGALLTAGLVAALPFTIRLEDEKYAKPEFVNLDRKFPKDTVNYLLQEKVVLIVNDFLANNGNNLKKNDLIDLYKKVTLANQLLEDPRSSVQVKLNLNSQLAQEIFRIKSDLKQGYDFNLVDPLVRDNDLRREFDTYKASLQKGEISVPEFLNKVDSLEKEENILSDNVKTKVYEFKQNYYDKDSTSINSKNPLVNKAANFILEEYAQEVTTADVLLDLGQKFEDAKNKNYRTVNHNLDLIEAINQDSQNAILKLEPIAGIRDYLEKLKQQINSLRGYANNNLNLISKQNAPILKKIDEQINSLKNTAFDKIANEGQLDQGIESLKNLINALPNNQLKTLFKLDKFNDSSDKESKINNYFDELFNLNLVQNANELINQIQANLHEKQTEKLLSNDQVTNFNTQIQNVLASANQTNLFDVLDQLANINDDILSVINSDENIESLVEDVLINQTNRALALQGFGKPNQVQANEIQQIKTRLQEARRNNEKGKALETIFNDEAENLRLLLKEMLANSIPLIQQTRLSTALQTSTLSQLNETLYKAETYSDPYSAATREQMLRLLSNLTSLNDQVDIEENSHELSDKIKDYIAQVEEVYSDDPEYSSHQVLNKQLNQILNEVERIKNDNTLTFPEKEEFLKQKETIAEDLANRAKAARKLEDSIREGVDTIKVINSDPEMSALLADDIAELRDLITRGNGELRDPYRKDMDQTEALIQAKIQEINDKAAQLQSQKLLDKIKKNLNKAVAISEKEGVNVTIQDSVWSKAQEVKKQIDSIDPNLSAAEQKALRDPLIAQLEKINESAQDSVFFDNARTKLQNTIDKAEFEVPNMPQELQDKVNQGKAKLAELNEFLDNINQDDITSAEEYQAKKAEADQLREEIELELALAKLNAEADKIKALAETDSEKLKNEPYNKLNEKLHAIEQERNRLVELARSNPENKVELTKEIENTTKNIAKQNPLLDALKKAGDKLGTIDAQKYPVIYENLKNTITDNLPLDPLKPESSETISNKIDALEEAVNKVESQKRLQDAIVDAQKVIDNQYNEGEDPNTPKRAIFNDLDAAAQTKLDNINKELADPNTSLARIKQLEQEAKKLGSDLQVAKDALNTRFNNDKTRIGNKINELLAQEKTNGIDTEGEGSENLELKQLKAAFETAKDDPNTTFEDLKAIEDKIQLAYYKDLFAKKLKDSQDKLKEIKDLTFDDESGDVPNQERDKVVEKMSALLDEINSAVGDATDPSKLALVQDKIAQLNKIDNLLEKQKDALPTIAEFSKPNSTTQPTELIAALEKNIPTLDDSPKQIDNENKDLQTAINKLVGTQRAKEKEKAKIQETLEDFKSKYDSAIHDAKVDDPTEGIKKIVADLNAEVEVVQDGPKVAEEIANIEQKNKELKNALPSILSAAQKVKEAQDLVAQTPEGEQTELQKAVAAEIETKIAEVREAYSSLEKAKNINNLENDLNALVEKFTVSTKIKTNLASAREKLNLMTYPEGTLGSNNQPIHGTPEANKTKFETFLTEIEKYSEDKSLTTTNLEEINYLVERALVLLDTEAQLITKQNLVNPANVNNSISPTYGYDFDARRLADVINISIPKNPNAAAKNYLRIDDINTLIKNLNQNYSKEEIIYDTRKQVFEAIAKDSETLGYKQQDAAELTESKYSKLLEEANKFYTNKLSSIVKELNINKMLAVQSAAAKGHNVLTSYKQIADAVQKGKDKIVAVSNKQNEKLTQAITLLNNAIASGESKYYTLFNTTLLNQEKEEIEERIDYIDLVVAYADKVAELNAETKLSEKQKAQLQAILDEGLNKANEPEFANTQGYKEIVTTYFTGHDQQISFNVALENSKALLETLETAKQYNIADLNDQPNEQSNYQSESIAMKALYDRLKQIVADSKTALETIPHNEINKKSLDSLLKAQINAIKNQKIKEANAVLNSANDLNNYLNSTYTDSSDTPKLADYEQVAITDLRNSKDTISNYESIKTVNGKIKAAQAKITEQENALFEFEKKKLKEKMDQIKPFIDYLKENSGVPELLGITYLTKLESEYTEAETQYQKTFTPEEKHNYKATLISSYLPSRNLMLQRYEQILNNTSSSLQTYKEGANVWKPQLEASTNSSKTIYDYATLLGWTDLTTKIDASKTASNEFSQLDASKDNLKTVDNFKSAIQKLQDFIAKRNDLVYGSSETDHLSIEDKYQFTIQNYADFGNMLKLLAGSPNNQYDANNPENNQYFGTISKYFSFQGQDALQNLESTNELLDVNPKPSTKAIISLLLKILNKANNLGEWLKNPINQDFGWEQLNKKTDLIRNNETLSVYNYVDFDASHAVLAEDFKNAVDAIAAQSGKVQTVNGKQAVLLNGEDTVLGLFKDFLILKGKFGDIYNTNNVKVYLYKKDGQQNFVENIFQADPTYKQSQINLMFVYEKPTNDPQNLYTKLPSYYTTFEDVFLTFNTSKYLLVTKESFTNKAKVLSTEIFDSKRGGFNAGNLANGMLSGFISNSIAIMNERNIPYLISNNSNDENVIENGKNYSSEKMSVKMKFKEGAQFILLGRTFRQTSDKVFWRLGSVDASLTPNNRRDNIQMWIPIIINVPLEDVQDPNKKTNLLLQGQFYFSYLRDAYNTNDLKLKFIFSDTSNDPASYTHINYAILQSSSSEFASSYDFSKYLAELFNDKNQMFSWLDPATYDSKQISLLGLTYNRTAKGDKAKMQNAKQFFTWSEQQPSAWEALEKFEIKLNVN
ncbi:hypothetical protein [Mycoplasmopsis gallopavonis]|uniref:Uncharacterized protein n=1 Tax=Mycoplasmopsis gallopavonis TaxID=76629 RepID=A0A449AZ29_9BACT|nr:hypothetical protein [Mycoplasmopsis gallopavonis]RIV16921.1 hypothetical protein D1113_00365 [Mycoplasmopsis gallopavonis]VEU72744.1 Uncharacterised protein [Mycoplasmopsis gallopavonis]